MSDPLKRRKGITPGGSALNANQVPHGERTSTLSKQPVFLMNSVYGESPVLGGSLGLMIGHKKTVVKCSFLLYS